MSLDLRNHTLKKNSRTTIPLRLYGDTQTSLLMSLDYMDRTSRICIPWAGGCLLVYWVPGSDLW